MNNELPASLARLAAAQHGVFSRSQALHAGITAASIKAKVRRGAWHPLYPGVYRTFSGEPDRVTRLWAVLLYAGRGAVLSHQTAAELHRLTGGRAAEIHVTIPGERRVSAVPGVRIHRSARVFEAALPHTAPPRTRVEDTVLDLAETAATFDEVCEIVTRAISQELTDGPELLAAVDARVKVRRRAELRELVAAAAAGDHSVLEFRYTRDVERPHGLPEPDRQVPFTEPGGRRGRRDRVYAKYSVIVELDGTAYHPAEGVSRDRARDRAAAALGLQSLRYGWSDVRQRPCDTAVEVAKVLRRHGWDAEPRPCSLRCKVQYDSSAEL